MHEPESSRGRAARVVVVLIIAFAVAPLCVAALRSRALRAAGSGEQRADDGAAGDTSTHGRCGGPHASR